jgi:aminomethyltransferase
MRAGVRLVGRAASRQIGELMDLIPSPLREQHVAAGAFFTGFAGWDMPLRYSSELAEHKAVRENAGLFDLSHMAEIVVLGPEAGAALDAALSTAPSALELGRAKYSLLLDEHGGVIDDLVVYRTGEDRFLVVANAANRTAVATELEARAARFDTGVYDESDDIALIALQGPQSLGILRRVPGIAIEGGHPDGEDVPETLAALRYYRSIAALVDGHPLLIARTGYTGEDGFELYLAPDDAPALWDALLETGGDVGLVPAGLAARDTLRLEAGMPLYGHELSRERMPAQAGIGVDLSKPVDFVGRGASERGPEADAPVLVGLAGEGRRAAREGYTVLREDAPCGSVTSGALSPTLGHPIAMAYVTPSAARIGTELTVDVRGTRVPFTVTELPFYRRKKN